MKTMTIRVSDYLRGRTKWGADPTIVVSLKVFKDGSMGCFRGYDCFGTPSARGANKKIAIENLLYKMVEYDNVNFF